MTTPAGIETKPLNLRTDIKDRLARFIETRHDLHAHPELSYEEHRTSEVIAAKLGELGIEHKRGFAKGTGIVAYIPATNGGGHRSVALRADIDALPIAETTGKPYASKTSGAMHACGHDGHTAILLGAAEALLNQRRPNPVTLIFQPAEEGGGGGERMCDEGALRGTAGGGLGEPVDRIFGLHGWPDLPLGTVAARPGPMLASTDDFVITIKGEQAHAAYPHLGRDAILAGAHVVTAVQSVASRSIDPLESIVVTVAEFHAGTANNIIPEQVTLTGTIRALQAETRRVARERFVSAVEHAAASVGCHADVELHEGYPVTSNERALTDHFFHVAGRTLGESRVKLLEKPSMGGEDFSYYGHHVPACFYLLGLKPEGQDRYPGLHQPDFDFNDDALAVGIEMMCALALAER